ncbi:MAG: MATE family efflux transporter [Polyangiaceae bacterium]|nr:MATE family efflux transporter [Polyangiaceae bacterium]
MAEIAAVHPTTNVVTSGPPFRAITRLALPTLVAMLTQSAVNEIDLVFFGMLPNAEGSNAQAALMPSLIVLWAFGGSLSAVSVGTQSMTARRFAEGDNKAAGAVVFNAFVFTLLGGTLFSLAAFFLIPLLVGSIISSPDVRAAATSYLGFRVWGVLSMACTAAFKAFFDGIGKTHVHLVSAVVMNVVNVALCILLIFGNLGFPRMGMAGAGLAGVVSTYLGLAVMIGYALKPEYRRMFQPFDRRKFDPQILKNLLKLSIPGGIATIAVMTGFALFAWIAGRLDTLHPTPNGEAVNAAATSNIVGVLKLTFTACLAFGTATATLVSQSLGEKDPAKASRFGWASIRLGLVIFGVVGIIEALAAGPILQLIAKESIPVQQTAYGPLIIMGLMTPVIAVGMILTQALFGAGDTLFVMIVELALHFICLVPLAYLLGVTFDLGIVGIFGAAATYIFGLAIAMVLRFRSGVWKVIKV